MLQSSNVGYYSISPISNLLVQPLNPSMVLVAEDASEGMPWISRGFHGFTRGPAVAQRTPSDGFFKDAWRVRHCGCQ